MTTSLGLLRQAVGRVRRRPGLLVENIVSWGRRLGEILRALTAVLSVRGRRHASPDQPSIFEARRTSLNGAAGIEKSFLRARVPLADVKRAAKARGVSVTDFVMATTSGAVKRLMEKRGDAIKKDLIAFVPINVRGEGDTAELGNQISGMLVALHTDVERSRSANSGDLERRRRRPSGRNEHSARGSSRTSRGCSGRPCCPSGARCYRPSTSSSACRSQT